MTKRRMGSREQAETCTLNLPTACYYAVHDFPGGVGAIAGQWGHNAAVLQNKLNPNMKEHRVNISELEHIAISTQDIRILQTVCSWYGAGYFILPKCESDESGLLEKSADLTREVSELMLAISVTLADGRVDADEVRLLDKALLELMASAGGLIAHAKRIGGIDQ